MDFNPFIIAKALHVVAVVLWIGGVAFVTSVLIPSIRHTQTPENRIKLFETLEGKFGYQAKITTLLAGVTGFYMVHLMGLWATMSWWIYLMIFIWGLFTLVLFVLEPLFLHTWFHQQAKKDIEQTFFYLQLMHVVLLSISLLAVFAGVAGAHGLFY